MQQTLLIYTSASPRIHYVFEQILAPRLGFKALVTADKLVYSRAVSPKIVYIQKNAIHEEETDMIQHKVMQKGGKINLNRKPELFEDLPSWTMHDMDGVPDPVAEIFIHLSRLEEYEAFEADKHGRFTGQKSILGQAGYLMHPVVDRWIDLIGKWLLAEGKLSEVRHPESAEVHPTFDIDIPWKFLHRNWRFNWRTSAKYLLNLDFQAWSELNHILKEKQKDPYDTYAYLLEKTKLVSVKPNVFFQVGGNTKFDRIEEFHRDALRALIKQLSQWWDIGLHPGYSAGESNGVAQISEEKQLLESFGGETIVASRQHFIRTTMPEYYENLLNAGIKKDYSCGFADTSGFRAGTAHAFPWYNVSKESSTTLTVFPFVFMDVTMRQYEAMSIDEAKEKIALVWSELKGTGGRLAFIWHNSSLCPTDGWEDWKAVFEYFLQLES